MKYEIGLIRVATTEDKELLELHGRILEENIPAFHVTSRCIEDQYDGVHDEESENRAVPKIVRLAEEEFASRDAVIISCAGDPAVEILRRKMGIPVIGAGESAAAAAVRCGERIAVMGITEEPPRAYKRILGDRIIDCSRPEGVRSILDLMTEKGRENALKLALRQKNLGVDAIAIACTGMANIGIIQEMRRRTGIPVIDPVLYEGMFALAALLESNDTPSASCGISAF